MTLSVEEYVGIICARFDQIEIFFFTCYKVAHYGNKILLEQIYYAFRHNGITNTEIKNQILKMKKLTIEFVFISFKLHLPESLYEISFRTLYLDRYHKIANKTNNTYQREKVR